MLRSVFSCEAFVAFGCGLEGLFSGIALVIGTACNDALCRGVSVDDVYEPEAVGIILYNGHEVMLFGFISISSWRVGSEIEAKT